MPNFHNANGSLSVYALSCGYVESYEDFNDVKNEVYLSLQDGVYSVKGYVHSKHVFKSFRTVKMARDFIKNFRMCNLTMFNKVNKYGQPQKGV
jgi:hypothetical protein